MKLTFNKIFETNYPEGFSLKRISSAEERLHIKLPKQFKDLYLGFAKSKIINSCHYFKKPEHLKFLNSEWLEFYIENQGVCFWAINKKDFKEQNLKVYIKLETVGYIEEAQSINDFLIIRSLDYAHLLFPYRMWCRDFSDFDERIVNEAFGKSKSNVQVNDNYRRTIYWKNEGEIVCINSSKTWGVSIAINSKWEKSERKIRELFPHIKWVIEPNRTEERGECISILRDEHTENTVKRIDSKNENNEFNDLPF